MSSKGKESKQSVQPSPQQNLQPPQGNSANLSKQQSSIIQHEEDKKEESHRDSNRKPSSQPIENQKLLNETLVRNQATLRAMMDEMKEDDHLARVKKIKEGSSLAFNYFENPELSEALVSGMVELNKHK
eukprot:TRINITY_DN25946_c0_g1_i1.p1 TRINITY_DN25946_c0_g1~~TRINITY_DN25946_c0_g1_i1.p1  ORF type:complete len:129 (-),score=30.54 TRINITY_DN25946_c0_g1_i1:158-544(-)